MKLLSAILGLVLFGTTGVANAIPFTYEFNMPAFTAGTPDDVGFKGQTSILEVEVDNGNATNINQSYLNTQITGYTVTIGALTLSLHLSSSGLYFQGSQTYITTNDFGAAILDLTADVESRALLGLSSSALGVIQLGTTQGSGPVQYWVQINGVSGLVSEDFIVDGDEIIFPNRPDPTTSIPEPSTIALFVIGLAGFGAISRRRRKQIKNA